MFASAADKTAHGTPTCHGEMLGLSPSSNLIHFSADAPPGEQMVAQALGSLLPSR